PYTPDWALRIRVSQPAPPHRPPHSFPTRRSSDLVFANGENLSKRRDSQTDPGGLGLYPGFGWTWPNNMRILYNRASCDRNGKPRSEEHTSELQSLRHLVCRLLLEKKKTSATRRSS